jgi:hypothetical protein
LLWLAKAACTLARASSSAWRRSAGSMAVDRIGRP